MTVSYFEWVQNHAGYQWTEGEVEERLEIGRVTKAHRLRGVYAWRESW